MPWDWVSFPEYLDSLDRTPKAINILPYVPAGPMLIEVLGLADAKAGRMPTDEEHARLAQMLHESMDAGGCGWSAQRLPPTGPAAVQRDWDGTPMPTDMMNDETALVFAEVLARPQPGRAAGHAHHRRHQARPGPSRRDRVESRDGRCCTTWCRPSRPSRTFIGAADRMARALPRTRHPGLRPGRDERCRVHVHDRGLEPLRRQ